MGVSIRIDAEGNTHIDVKGVEGTSCETLTEALIRGLGDVEETQYTEEYEQTEPDYIESFEE